MENPIRIDDLGLPLFQGRNPIILRLQNPSRKLSERRWKVAWTGRARYISASPCSVGGPKISSGLGQRDEWRKSTWISSERLHSWSVCWCPKWLPKLVKSSKVSYWKWPLSSLIYPVKNGDCGHFLMIILHFVSFVCCDSLSVFHWIISNWLDIFPDW